MPIHFQSLIYQKHPDSPPLSKVNIIAKVEKEVDQAKSK